MKRFSRAPVRVGRLSPVFLAASAFSVSLAIPEAPAAAAETSGGPAVATHPYTIRDQVMLRRLSDPVVSPDGRLAAFTLRTTDYSANRGRTDVYVTGVDGGGLRQLTNHEGDDGDPEFSPDSRFVYFLSSRDAGKGAIYRVPSTGGNAELVYKTPLEIESFHLSPDGKTIVFAASVYPDCDSLECTVKRVEAKGKTKATGQVFEKLFVRHWDEWKNGRRSHLFAVPVGGGTAVDLMRGLDMDSPVRPHPERTDYAFTKDSQAVVFAAREGGRSEAWSTNVDLFSVPVGGQTAPKNLTKANAATDTYPVFSPDGKTLAYLAMSRPQYESDRLRLMIKSWPDGGEKELTVGWDRSPHSIAFSRDGKTIYATADDVGQRRVFAIDVATAKAKPLSGEGSSDAPQEAAGGRIVYALNSLKSPAELFSMKTDGSDAKPITRVNPELSAMAMGDAEQFSFKGASGETVYAYLVKPVGFDPKRKYPVAFLIHGGPQGTYSNGWSYRWNPQAYAGHGYAAVMVDFHGSTGYGQAFTDSIRGDWGGKPFEDLKKGLAAALGKYAFLDGTRVAALGASYGGYMINWIAGNWNDRFRCLVNHDGNLDERFAYFDTDELWFPEWEHGGTPWDNPAGYGKHNPLDHVKKWKTPMLVIHGGRDFRVVETQGLSTFAVLQRKGIPSKFLYFPDENHWVLKAQNSVLWHDTVLAWLDQWTGGAAQ